MFKPKRSATPSDKLTPAVHQQVPATQDLKSCTHQVTYTYNVNVYNLVTEIHSTYTLTFLET